jgi:hypothetical protein
MKIEVSDKPAAKAKRRWWRQPKKIIIILVVLIVLGALVSIVNGLHSPAVGSINQTPPAHAEVIDPYSQPGTYNGKYISFTYPPHYKITPSKPSGNLIEVAEYHSTGLTFTQINVAVQRENLNDDSGLIYRQKHPELYSQNSSKIGLEFKKLDGTEDTFFLQHDGLVATVSVTSPGGNTGTDALFVGSGLHWK